VTAPDHARCQAEIAYLRELHLEDRRRWFEDYAMMKDACRERDALRVKLETMTEERNHWRARVEVIEIKRVTRCDQLEQERDRAIAALVALRTREDERRCAPDVKKADTIGGYNTFLKDQQAAPGEATVTLAQFNEGYELLHDMVPIAQVTPLTPDTYCPGGNTALRDAIARTINATGKKLAAMAPADRPERVLFLIITDGLENASTDFTQAQVAEMIHHQREVYKWDFVFLGADESVIAQAPSIGIAAAHVAVYTATSRGTNDLYANASIGTRAYRGGQSLESLVSHLKK
jgi:hypothetical protein